MLKAGFLEYFGDLFIHTKDRQGEVMQMLKQLCLIILLILPVVAQSDRIKDVATLAGVRINQLVGYGLVVGLDGTGDKTGTKFTEQSFRNMLTQLGINIPPGTKLSSKNIAAVMVTAELRSFMKKGQMIDVNVSSIGDAKSLRGGTLLMTPLKGVDGRVYAISQGNLIVAGFGVQGSDGSKITVNVPSGGRIPNGATIERNIPNPFAKSRNLIYNLHSPDFTTARNMADAINELMGPGTAKPIDAASVQVSAPKKMSQRVDYVSVLENIKFKIGARSAKIIVNARTGTVVIGQHVRVTPAAVSHGNLIVTISENPVVSQPNPLSLGQTVVAPNTQINVQAQTNRAFVFAPGASLKEIVKAINAVGAAPGDLVAILEALKQVGALNARLIVI
jgi:flagellar P-ring protein precursor FlgI